MFKALKKAQQGFTIIELLIVIAIIAILAGLVLNNFRGAQAKARDTQRVTDVNAVHSKLEEYYNENGYYPASVPTTNPALSALFPGIDAEAVKDPKGIAITSSTVADAAAATADMATATVAASYRYAAIPTGCAGTVASPCTSYKVGTFIEKTGGTLTSPYVKDSLN